MQKIIVKKFGPIEFAEIEINDFVVLIGEQASGKSTIAKLIYFFQTLKEDIIFEVSESTERNTPDAAARAVIKKLQDKFALYFGSARYYDNEYNIKFYFTDERFIELSRTPLSINFEPKQFFNDIVNAFLQFKTTRESQNINSGTKLLYLIENLRRGLNSIFYDDKKYSFIPAGRNITTAYGDTINTILYGVITKNIDVKSKFGQIDLFLMHEFLEKVSEFKVRFNNKTFLDLISDNDVALGQFANETTNILKGKYSNSNGNEEIIVEGREMPVPLSQASTGQQESIRILQDIFLSVLDNQPSFKIIEEPEAHLSPHGQNGVIKLMVSLLGSVVNQKILITTHSDHILNGLLVATKKFDLGETGGISHERTRVYFFHKEDNALKTKVIEIPILKGGKIKNPPIGFFDQISTDRKYLMGF